MDFTCFQEGGDYINGAEHLQQEGRFETDFEKGPVRYHTHLDTYI